MGMGGDGERSGVEGGQRRTFAILCNPSLCSVSGDVPRALAITAQRPKNILAELQSKDGRQHSFTKEKREELVKRAKKAEGLVCIEFNL